MKSTDRNSQEYKIFKQASRTYFTASIFFPAAIKEEIFSLYAFVRTADNLVDSPQKSYDKFVEFKEDYYTKQGKNPIVHSFLQLEKKHKFKPEWTKAFLDSMEIDFCLEEYHHLDELNRYIYGSAEVIGLYIARILELPAEAHVYAQKLGAAMQLANFIRDISEDLEFGRTYIPQEDLQQVGLKTIQLTETKANPEKFAALIKLEVERYKQLQSEAERGYKYLAKRYLVPIKTAADMYQWTIEQIAKDPFIVYSKKVKPSALRVILTAFRNYL